MQRIGGVAMGRDKSMGGRRLMAAERLSAAI
jgi:hypothetical protein